MKILFLDDRAVRRVAFLTKHPQAVCVETSDECIFKLKQESWDMVCLDHDLQNGDTGMRVVEWIISQAVQPPALFIIHSTNLFFAMQMLQRLKGSGYFATYVPFDMSPGGPFNL